MNIEQTYIYAAELGAQANEPDFAPTHIANYANVSCGDTLTVRMLIQKGKIKKLHFAHRGCALSAAACAWLCQALEGEEILACNSPKLQSKIIKFFGVNEYSPRTKCALAPVYALASIDLL